MHNIQVTYSLTQREFNRFTAMFGKKGASPEDIGKHAHAWFRDALGLTADLTVSQAAVELGVSRMTVNRWLKLGMFKNAYARSGRKTYIPLADIEAMKQDRRWMAA